MSRPSFRSGLFFLCLLLCRHHFTVHSQSLCKPGNDGLPPTANLSPRSISVNPPLLTIISTDLIVYQMNSSSLNTTTNQLHLVDVRSEPLLRKWPILSGSNLTSAYSIFTLAISKKLYLFLLFATKSKEHKKDRIFDLVSGTVYDGIHYDEEVRAPIWLSSSSTGRLYLLYPRMDGSLVMQRMVRPQSVSSPFLFHIYEGFRIPCYNSNDGSLRLIDIGGDDECTSEGDQLVKWNISYGFARNGVVYLFAKDNKHAYRFKESTYDTMAPVPLTIIPLETFFICPTIDESSTSNGNGYTTNRSVLATDIRKRTNQKTHTMKIIILIFFLISLPFAFFLVASDTCRRMTLTEDRLRESPFKGCPSHTKTQHTEMSSDSSTNVRGSTGASQHKVMPIRGSKLKRKSNRLIGSSKHRTYKGIRAKQGKLKVTSKGSCGTDGLHFSPLAGSAGSLLKATGNQRRVQTAHKRLSRKATHTRIPKKCT